MGFVLHGLLFPSSTPPSLFFHKQWPKVTDLSCAWNERRNNSKAIHSAITLQPILLVVSAALGESLVCPVGTRGAPFIYSDKLEVLCVQVRLPVQGPTFYRHFLEDVILTSSARTGQRTPVFLAKPPSDSEIMFLDILWSSVQAFQELEKYFYILNETKQKKNFTFQSSFRFTPIVNRRHKISHRSLPCHIHSLPHYQHALSQRHICCNQWSYTDTPLSPKAQTVQSGSLSCVFSSFWQTCNNIYPPL